MRSLVVGLGSLLLVGCAMQGEDPGSGEFALQGGCRVVCPHCPPNKVCPKIACYLDCHAPSPCGPGKCQAGEVCCNESCGICTEPGGFCTEQFCEPVEHGHECLQTALCVIGYHFSQATCMCMPDHEPKGRGCTVDEDCRTFSDYCTGCDCLALGVNDPDPVCDGPGVRCFVDPCFQSTAVCLNGSCSLK